MKYTGTILGLKSSYGSIYHVVTDDTKCYLWKANIDAELNEKMLTISFNWNGDFFQMKLTELKEDYYTGKIFYNNDEGGNAYLWVYTSKDNLILKGNFIEDDAGTYDCFIELKILKT